MKKGSKKLGNLTPKQAKYIEAHVVKGMTKKDAVKHAGYAPSVNSSAIERQENMKNAMVMALSKRGLTEDKIAQKIEEGLDAVDTHYFAFEGKVVDQRDAVDYSIREKYIRDFLELKGYIKNNTIENLNIGLIALPSEKDDALWNVVEAESDKTPNIDGINKT
jgi:hypothetical protein